MKSKNIFRVLKIYNRIFHEGVLVGDYKELEFILLTDPYWAKHRYYGRKSSASYKLLYVTSYYRNFNEAVDK